MSQENKQSEKLSVVVFYGSCRKNRLGIDFAKILVKRLTARGHTTTLLDADAEKLPLLEKPLYHYQQGEEIPEQLLRIAAILEKADGFVICDGEYNHSPTPGMLNLIDHFSKKQYNYKPACICNYGGFMGGARSAYVLRNTCGEVGMITCPTIFNLTKVWESTKDGELVDKSKYQLLDTCFEEFEFFATALSAQRKKVTTKI